MRSRLWLNCFKACGLFSCEVLLWHLWLILLFTWKTNKINIVNCCAYVSGICFATATSIQWFFINIKVKYRLRPNCFSSRSSFMVKQSLSYSMLDIIMTDICTICNFTFILLFCLVHILRVFFCICCHSWWIDVYILTYSWLFSK